MQERQFTILFSFAFALNGAAVYGFVPAATARFDASLAGFARGLFFRAAAPRCRPSAPRRCSPAPRCRPSQIRLASQPHADMDAAGAETMALFMEIEALRRTQEKLEATIGAFRSEITAIRRAQVELEEQIAEKDEEIRILQAKATENANRLVLEQSLKATGNDKELLRRETEQLIMELRKMRLLDDDIAHIMRERNRLKPPKPGSKPWRKDGFSKRFQQWLGLQGNSPF